MEDEIRDDRAVRATAPVGSGRKRRRWEQGRRCEHEGCTTVISVYNRAGTCWLHQQPAWIREGRHADDVPRAS